MNTSSHDLDYQILNIFEVEDYPEQNVQTVTILNVPNTLTPKELVTIIGNELEAQQCYTYRLQDIRRHTCWGASGSSHEVLLWLPAIAGIAGPLLAALISHFLRDQQPQVYTPDLQEATHKAKDYVKTHFPAQGAIQVISAQKTELGFQITMIDQKGCKFEASLHHKGSLTRVARLGM